MKLFKSNKNETVVNEVESTETVVATKTNVVMTVVKAAGAVAGLAAVGAGMLVLKNKFSKEAVEVEPLAKEMPETIQVELIKDNDSQSVMIEEVEKEVKVVVITDAPDNEATEVIVVTNEKEVTETMAEAIVEAVNETIAAEVTTTAAEVDQQKEEVDN